MVYGPDNVLIKGSLLADDNLVKAVLELESGQGLFFEDQLLACRIPDAAGFRATDSFQRIDYDKSYREIRKYLGYFFHQRRGDGSWFSVPLTAGRNSAPISQDKQSQPSEPDFFRSRCRSGTQCIKCEFRPHLYWKRTPW